MQADSYLVVHPGPELPCVICNYECQYAPCIVSVQAAFDMVVEPVVQSYQPDLIIVAAGFDAAKGDPLGGCRLTPQVCVC